LFFTASVASLHGNDEFVRQLHSGELITVHRASIKSMSGSNVTLSNGELLASDAVVFATGWEYKSDLFDPSVAIDLGISAPLEYQDATTTSYWDKLQAKAEEDVLEVLPMLKTPPSHYERPLDHTPTRLYRYILPSSLAAKQDHSLILLGLVTSIQTSISAEVSALWGVAWMEGLLEKIHSMPNKAEMDYEIAKVNAWSARRYLSRGRQRQVASAEIQDVIDMWVKDLGLRVHRKGGLLGIRDTFLPYRAQDYQGIVREVLDKTKYDKRA
jgi:dimethylaniline monooxygenase (N-oxide forming)